MSFKFILQTHKTEYVILHLYSDIIMKNVDRLI